MIIFGLQDPACRRAYGDAEFGWLNLSFTIFRTGGRMAMRPYGNRVLIGESLSWDYPLAWGWFWEMPRILFVCAQNKLRSPTAETIFSRFDQLDCLSAGIHPSANNPLDRELVEWADVIFTMEKKHKAKIQQRFRSSLNGKQIISLDIPDKFQYMEPALIELLEKRVKGHLQKFL